MKIDIALMTDIAHKSFGEQKSVRQIGEELGISPATVSRVMTELRKANINEDNYKSFSPEVLFAMC